MPQSNSVLRDLTQNVVLLSVPLWFGCGQVFAMQGTGILAAAIVTLIVSSIFNAFDGNPDHIWRLVLMFGAIPTTTTMYARLHMPETPRYTLFVAQNNQGLVGDESSVSAGSTSRAAAWRGSASADLASVPQRVGSCALWLRLDVVSVGHCILQPKLVSIRHFHCCWLATCCQHDAT